MVLLFDAANTLIHKPTFYDVFLSTLKEFEIQIDKTEFKKIHKIISECYNFPDRTDKTFYSNFNKDVLNSLGIVSNQILLDRLFETCSYLPWEKFDDTDTLNKLPYKKAILSNFSKGLIDLIDTHLPNLFSDICYSENEEWRKPDIQFYEGAVKRLGVKPSEIIYFGDSVKLDLEPALSVGINAWLIDRENHFPYCERRINSFSEIQNIIDNL